MTSLKEYLIILLSTKNIESIVDSNNLDYITNELLRFIALYPNSSTNDCYMYLNEIFYASISYDDTDLKIKNLIDLGLIQNVKNNENTTEEDGSPISREKLKHSEYIKNYSISSAGIFYLFATYPESIDIGLVVENKEDGLFVNFLYSCLDFETVDKLRDTRTIIHFKRFLGKCCQTIREVLKTLREIEEKGGESNSIGFVQGLANTEYDDGFHGPRSFIKGLKNLLNIEWLNEEETKVVELEKNKLFKIHDEEKKNELLLKICSERNVAELLDNRNHKIREFYLEDLGTDNKDYAIRYFNAITVEDFIDKLFDKEYFFFYAEIDEYESEFCEELLIHMHTTYPIINKEDRMIQRQDCIAIAKDKRFQKLTKAFKYKIDCCHNNFIRLSHSR